MHRIHFSCLYPILLAEQTYFRLRFQRFAPTVGFQRLSAETCPERYRHLLHSNSEVYLSALPPLPGLEDVAAGLGLPEPGQARVDVDLSGCTLLYEARFALFLMDIQLVVEISDAALAAAPDALLDLQARVRLALVDDPRTPELPCPWALAVQAACLERVRATIVERVPSPELSVPPSMGYIVSIFPEAAAVLPAERIDRVIERFHAGDQLKTRLPEMQALPYAGDGRGIFLGWQSSTLWGVDAETTATLLPVFLNIQIVYTLYQVYFLPISESLFEEVFHYEEDRFQELQARTDRVLILIDKTVHDTHAIESRLRPMQLSTHHSLWAYWGMPKSHAACAHSLQSARRSLEMNSDIIQEKIGDRQNNLLFILAVVQISAMVSVVTDWVALSDQYVLVARFVAGMLLLIVIIIIILGYYDRLEQLLRRRGNGR